MIKALVIMGADVKLRNKKGMSVYEVAKAESCRTTMSLLSAVGADDTKFLECKKFPAIEEEGIITLLNTFSKSLFFSKFTD